MGEEEGRARRRRVRGEIRDRMGEGGGGEERRGGSR